MVKTARSRYRCCDKWMSNEMLLPIVVLLENIEWKIFAICTSWRHDSHWEYCFELWYFFYINYWYFLHTKGLRLYKKSGFVVTLLFWNTLAVQKWKLSSPRRLFEGSFGLNGRNTFFHSITPPLPTKTYDKINILCKT